MKRDKNLYPLSHQHHNGLMAVLLLEKGLKKNADLKIMNDFIIYCWEAELDQHFTAEEKYLDPSLLQLPEVKDLYQQMLTEHQQIRKIIDEIKQGKESNERIQSFHTLLENHIRFEEREMFNHIQEVVSEDELKKACEKMEKRSHDYDKNWKDTFWITNN